MRTIALLALLATLLPACASDGPTPKSGGRTTAPAASGSKLRPEDVKPATDPVLVTWLSFKEVNPRDGKPTATHVSLINKAHPQASKPIPIDAYMKVLTNEQMGAVLALLDEKGFGKLSSAGLTAENAPSARGNGIVVVTRGSASRGLLFPKGLRADASPIPGVFIECKKIILGVFDSADQFQVYTSDQDRVLQIDPRVPGDVRR